MTIEKPGYYPHTEISAEAYHADPAPKPSASASVLWILRQRSPLHAWTEHPRLNPEFEPTFKAIFDLGSAAHNVALRQDKWREQVVVIDAKDWRTKKAKDERDSAREAGGYPLLVDQYEGVNRMISVLERHPEAGRAFTDGEPEGTLIWRDKPTGAWCRCRPDWISKDRKVFPNYKTTQDGSPGPWSRRFVLDQGGVFKAAHYEAGIKAVFGAERALQYMVVQEVAPPYAVAIRVVDSHSKLMEIGRRQWRAALDKWAECLKAGEWPSYPLLDNVSLPLGIEDRLASEVGISLEAK
jgi:hypothetical protein